MDNSRYPGISCEHCGSISPRAFLSCEHRRSCICPYVLEKSSLPPGRLPGILMTVMGLLFLVGFAVLPFFLASKKPIGAYGLIANTLMLAFSFTISIIFVLFGVTIAALRKSIFYNKAQQRYVEIHSLFSLPLAYRVVTLDGVAPIAVRVPPLPLSLAGFFMERPIAGIPSPVPKSPPGMRSRTLDRLNDINSQLDRGVVHALIGAIAHLAAHSCVVFRSARQETFSRWYTPTCTNTYYINAGEGRSDDLGLLEGDLLKKITNWRSHEGKAEDMIAPTFADLIMTFQDSDGDFSAYQIRKLILADGESRGIFKKTSEGLLGKLLPKIEPAAEASDDIKEGQKIIEEAARRLHESGRLGNDISLALSKTVFKKTEKSPGSLDEQNAALRIRLLYYVIGFSLALAFALSCLAAC